MTAEQRARPDCPHCQSAGSIRNGRCEICEFEPALDLRHVRPQAAGPAVADIYRDEGTLTGASG